MTLSRTGLSMRTRGGLLSKSAFHRLLVNNLTQLESNFCNYATKPSSIARQKASSSQPDLRVLPNTHLARMSKIKRPTLGNTATRYSKHGTIIFNEAS